PTSGVRSAFPAKARMYSRSESLVVGHPLKQLPQGLALLLVQRRQERVLVLLCDAPDCLEGTISFRRQMERITSPVVETVPPLDQFEPLELIDHGHTTTRKDPQVIDQRLLTDPGLGAQSS